MKHFDPKTVPHSPFPPVETEEDKKQPRLKRLIGILEATPDGDYDHAEPAPFECGTPACAWGHALADPVFQHEGIGVEFLTGSFFGRFQHSTNPFYMSTYPAYNRATRTDVIAELKKHIKGDKPEEG